MPRNDLTGQRFGRLVVLSHSHAERFRTKSGNASTIQHWVCECDCGSIKTYRQSNLLHRHANPSCGCLKDELSRQRVTHGQSRRGSHSKAYRTWANMIQRCANPKGKKNKAYKDIDVDTSWVAFENFYRDMGDPPSPRHSIERKNVKLGYAKDNCEWIILEKQARNRNATLRATIDGVTKPLIVWCEEKGLSHQTIRQRVYRGATPEQALLA